MDMLKKASRRAGILIALFMLGTSASGMAAPSADAGYPIQVKEVGMPNPMVAYSSLAEVQVQLGFRPLTIARAVGYECSALSVIDGVMANLDYTALPVAKDANSTFCVRSAELAKVADLKGDISGVYSVTWEKKKIGQSTVYFAKISDTSFVVHWTRGKYAFSALGSGIGKEAFLTVVRDNLVPESEIDYSALD